MPKVKSKLIKKPKAVVKPIKKPKPIKAVIKTVKKPEQPLTDKISGFTKSPWRKK